MNTTATERPISDKQRAYIERLLAGRDLTGTAYDGWTPNWDNATSKAASSVITYLMSLPLKETKPTEEVPEGMHQVGNDIFKVQRAVHGSGNLYAKKLIAETTEVEALWSKHEQVTWSFEYAPGALRQLSTDTAMSLDKAKEFGQLYGVCCVCGRTLTDEHSIAEGIGPICAAKF